MQTSQKIKGKKAVFFIESQPPHIGELLQVINVLDSYEFLYLCINPNPVIMPINHVLTLWTILLQPYAERVKIVTFEAQLQEIALEELPKLFTGCAYLTDDRVAYVHLSSLNIEVQLVPKALGYYGVFLRNAYRQSRAFTYLENAFLNPTMRKK